MEIDIWYKEISELVGKISSLPSPFQFYWISLLLSKYAVLSEQTNFLSYLSPVSNKNKFYDIFYKLF